MPGFKTPSEFLGTGASGAIIPDGLEDALDIESTESKDFLQISTATGDESVRMIKSEHYAYGDNLNDTPRMTITSYSSSVAFDTGAGSGRDFIFRPNASESVKFIAEGGTVITGPGGTTGMAPATDGSAPTLYLENSTASSKDRCNLVMNADGSVGSVIDMYVSDDRKLLIQAKSDQQVIMAEDDLVFKSDPSSATRATISATAFTTENLLVSSTGPLATALTDSGGTASVSTSGSSTALTGVNTAFTTDFHIGAAIKVGTVTTTVTAIADDNNLTLEDAINTSSTGVGCTRDSGELFAVKTGDSKTLFSVTGTGAIQAGSAGADSHADNNLAIGDSDALDNITQHSGGERNYIFGHASSNYSLSTGQRNCFMGYAAGQDINSGFDNVLLGAYAGSDGTSMQGATHLGYSAGGAATGNDTVFVGRAAGEKSTGSYNTSVGSFSLASDGTATSASYITALGYKTLTQDAGSYNTAVGAYALEDNVAAGTHNTVIGYTAGNNATDNDNMVLIGSGAQPSANSGITNEIAIGKDAAGQGSNTIMLGDSNITGLHCYDTSISSPSDSRIKDNVQDSGLGLDFINALRPVKYEKKHPSDFPEEIREARWADREVTRTRANDDNETEEYIETIPADTKPADWQARTEYGLIAQEVKAAMEAQGGADWHGHTVLPSGMEALGYGKLITVLVKAVQELTARIATLEAGD